MIAKHTQRGECTHYFYSSHMACSSQVASLTTDGMSVTTLEMTLKKNVDTADVEMNPGAVTTLKENRSARSWKTTLKSIPVPVWEALVLTPVLLIIIGLFMLPTVFYAQPSKQVRVITWERSASSYVQSQNLWRGKGGGTPHTG